MLITQKKQYALRAIFELAKRHGRGPIKISTIARVQAIPMRFLEVILNELKKSGFVSAKRGYQGGYYLLRRPRDIAVGDVIRFMDKTGEGEQDCIACVSKDSCPFDGQCALSPMWEKVWESLFCVYDGTTMQDLLELELERIKNRKQQENAAEKGCDRRGLEI
ncbi:MAG: Rrf2 family transcriptional regulator [Desulfatibacillaceae bacterium]|nr:Rrf2 family transcriptional regulator [Desulfatibacillaceae bacterium]